MRIFGRKRRQVRDEESATDNAVDRPAEDDVGDDEEQPTGPFDVADMPDDGVPRINLGSVQIPIPSGAQVQAEMDQASGKVRAVHVVTGQGQVTVSAYAAPRSGGLWEEVIAELSEQLSSDGAQVRSTRGEWGRELSAIVGEVALRFVGVDGPRWMLRGVIAGPQSQAEAAVQMLRTVVRGTVVDRGEAPMPVRTPLKIELPESVAAYVAEQQNRQQGQQHRHQGAAMPPPSSGVRE